MRVGYASTSAQREMPELIKGYDGSLMNGLLTNPRFVSAIDNPDANMLGLISAAYPLGGIAGILPAPWVADKYGRRMAVMCGALCIIAGGLVQTFTTGGKNMLGGRLIVGVGSAFQSIGTPSWVAETAHPRNRAQTSALINTCWYIGSIIAAWTVFGALDIQGSWSWRLCCLIQIFPCCIQLGLLFFTEESPRWLIRNGKEQQALRILARFHANGDQNDELVQFEFQEICQAIAAEQVATAGVTLMSFTKTKGNRHRLLILIVSSFGDSADLELVGVYSQWVGNGIISYYLGSILSSVGLTGSLQQAGFNGGLQIFNWLAAMGGSLLCERLGRRFLWLTSAIGMLASFIIITACSAVYANTQQVAAGRAVMAFLFIYFGFYDIAFTGLTLAYPLEILPFSLRAKGLAILNFTISAALFFNQYVNPIALKALAWKYYFVYIGVLVTAVLSIYFFYPETRRRTLEEVSLIFDGPDAQLPVQEDLVREHMSDLDEKKQGDAYHVESVNGGK